MVSSTSGVATGSASAPLISRLRYSVIEETYSGATCTSPLASCPAYTARSPTPLRVGEKPPSSSSAAYISAMIDISV